MLNHYLPLLIILTIAVLFGFLIIIIGTIFGPRRPTEKKAQPYESGMVPYGPGRRKISVKYYLVAVLFIIFDIEVVFFMPWAVSFRELGVPAFVLILIFVIILEVAFVYAWKKGAMEWE